ncbi:efflux RND transporter periplasmic adaptor subunit [Pseudochryseolinea flava]|uniref:Efflux transporter periplasmic adaptor subunit n=1 Tax=Pseudochryseolinea flava TaxID=2059302 RepID=A0A364XX98_9BACT|nr:efflux RND transporter periplasmic adaptor subunit [Pseudochryseolinea flava]RAV98616.1 efflux transporter periplasmic adaptor subunit [Pseudochryseolinea flava]
MDKQIVKKKWTLKRIATFGGISLFVIVVAYQLIFADRRSTLKIDKDKITISEVKRGNFQEWIPQTGTVEPSRTVYLDAVEGGTIKRVVAESGAMLKKGDVILELSNLNRELDVLAREAALNESITRVRDTRLAITRNDLEQRRMLAEIDGQLAILEPQYLREKQLFEKKLISKQQFEKTQADYKYNIQRRDITYGGYRADSVDRIRQLRELNSAEYRMGENLDGVGRILDNLVIRAPMDGQLSRPQLDAGQNVTGGQRLGQVDVVGSYKVKVPIDEIYLPRISTGLIATTTLNNKDYTLEITYIYPTIQNGRFEVDMNFTGDLPSGIRRGQSVRLRIGLGQTSEELLLPVGGFFKDTGGNSIFVLTADNKAEKRPIKLGRRSGNEYFEVLEGLQPGDKVITSSYENFGTSEVLVLN